MWDSADEHLDQWQGPEVHREMEAMVCAFGAWGLKTAGGDAHKAQPCGQCLHGGHGAHLPQQSVDPWTTGAQARRHRLVGHGLIQGRNGAGHLAQGFVQATLEEDHTQELRWCLDLFGPHTRVEFARHLHGLLR